MTEDPAAGSGRRGAMVAFRAIPFFIVFACGATFAWCAVRDEPFNISWEDGLVEWGTVYFMAVCAVLALAAFGVDRRILTRSQRVFLIVFTVVALVAAGEELSWGQRLFQWTVPDAMREAAGGLIQAGHDDLTLHNLSFRSRFLKFSIGGTLFGVVLIAVLFLHGIWLPLARRRDDALAAKLVDRLGIFVPPLGLGALAFVVGAVFHYLKPFGGMGESREYKEFLLPLLWAFMLVECYFEGGRRKWAAWGLVAAIVLWGVGSVVLETQHDFFRFR